MPQLTRTPSHRLRVSGSTAGSSRMWRSCGRTQAAELSVVARLCVVGGHLYALRDPVVPTGLEGLQNLRRGLLTGLQAGFTTQKAAYLGSELAPECRQAT